MFHGDTKWKRLLMASLPTITEFTFFGDLYIDKCMNLASNPFWKHVFRAYNAFHKKIKINTFSEYLAESVFHNSNIKIGNKGIFRRVLYDAGVSQVADFYFDNGDLMSWQEFKQYQEIENINYLDYYSITKAINKYLLNLNIKREENNVASERPAAISTLINENVKASQIVYNILITSDSRL